VGFVHDDKDTSLKSLDLLASFDKCKEILLKDKLFSKLLKLLFYPSISTRVLDFIESFDCTFLFYFASSICFLFSHFEAFLHSTRLGRDDRATPDSLHYQGIIYIQAERNFKPIVSNLE
jgi:hypothetical protein